MKKYIPLFFSILSTSPAILADNKVNPCESPQSSQEIFTCSKISLMESDKNLNNNYKDLINYIERSYSTNPELRDKLKAQTKNSQLIWIKLRDANCAIETFTIEPQSQAFETTKNNCSKRQTEERSEYLLNLMKHTL